MHTPKLPGDDVDENSSIDALIRMLHSTEGVASWRAAETLVARGERAVEPLTGVACDRQAGLEARVRAIVALGRLRDARAIAALGAILEDPHALVRFNSARALGMIGSEQAIGYLLTALEAGDEDVRRASERALVRLGKPAVSSLVGALTNTHGRVRASAARALGDIRDRCAAEPLRAVVSDKAADVRWFAVEALGHLRDAESLDLLIGALHDSDPIVRGAAASALGELGDARAVPALELVSQYDTGRNWEGDEVKEVAQEAIEWIQARRQP